MMWSRVLRGLHYQLLSRRLISTSQQLAEKGLNKVQLIGRVGHIPKDYKNATTGKSVVFFPMGIDRAVKARSEDGREVVSTIKTTWVSVKVLKPPLQDIIMRLVQRGSRVYVGGKLENWRYISKEDGSIHFFTVVIADDFIHLHTNEAGNFQNKGTSDFEQESLQNEEESPMETELPEQQ